MPLFSDILTGTDGIARCGWCGDDPLYRDYHDREWGMPLLDDRGIYEKLCLEGFQAGLAWITILRKRENFRRAFANFEIDIVRAWGEREIRRLLADPGIVRHRGKIESAINNARRAAELREEFGSLRAFIRKFAASAPFRGLPSSTPRSRELSKEFKKRGFSFVGPTTAYAFMQSAGLVNDHFPACHRREPCETARNAAWF